MSSETKRSPNLKRIDRGKFSEARRLNSRLLTEPLAQVAELRALLRAQPQWAAQIQPPRRAPVIATAATPVAKGNPADLRSWQSRSASSEH